MEKIVFNVAYRPQVESGEYRVVTREDRPVEIRIWDLKGDFPIVGVYYDAKNNRETAVQVTAEGRCSVTPGEEYCDDFFIITSKPEITEFRKELATMVDYAINHAKPGVNVVDIFADRILEYAKLEFEKDAVEAVSCTFSNSASKFLKLKDSLDTKDGDKVKLIIIKEDSL